MVTYRRKPRHSEGPVPQEGTLFGDDFVEQVAIELGSRDDAYRSLGIVRPVDPVPELPVKGENVDTPDALTDETAEGIDEEALLAETSAAGKKRSVRMQEALEHGIAIDSLLGLVRYSLREATTSKAGNAHVVNRILAHQQRLLKDKTKAAIDAASKNDFEEPELPDPDMPKNTMFAVMREYKAFITRSRSAETALTQVLAMLEDQDESRPLAEIAAFAEKDWRKEAFIYKAVVTLQMMSNAEALAASETDKLPKVDDYYTKDEQVIEKLDAEVVQSTTVEEVRARIEEGIERYQKARHYWIRQLEEVVEYSQNGRSLNWAGVAAKSVLSSFGIRRPSTAA